MKPNYWENEDGKSYVTEIKSTFKRIHMFFVVKNFIELVFPCLVIKTRKSIRGRRLKNTALLQINSNAWAKLI